MAPGLVLFVGVVYLVIALDLWVKGNTGLAIAFGGYAISNVGLYMAAK